MGAKTTLGLIGSMILFVGVFTPIVSMPLVGSMNYFQNGKGGGVLIMIIAIFSLILVLKRRFGGLWFTGITSLLLLAFTFARLQMKISGAQKEVAAELAGNPFRGLADVAMQSVQVQWGWAILVVGAGLLIASAVIKDDSM